MAYLKSLLLVTLFVANCTLSLAYIPPWEALGGYAHYCLSSSLTYALGVYPGIISNIVCSSSQLDANVRGHGNCPDFCDDPAWNITLSRCLNNLSDKWIAQEVMLLSNHVICNASLRDSIEFTYGAGDDWTIHWPQDLHVTGTETFSMTAPTSSLYNPFGVPSSTTTHHALRREPGDRPKDFRIPPGSTKSPFVNTTASSDCYSVGIVTATIMVTVLPSSFTSIISPTASTSCNCSSTSTKTVVATTTLPTTVRTSDVSIVTASFNTPASSASSAAPPPGTITTTSSIHLTATATATRSGTTSSMPALKTVSCAAAPTGIDRESKYLLALGGAGVLLNGLI